MPMLQKMRLHETFLPAIEIAITKAYEEGHSRDAHHFEEWRRVALNGTIFDVRHIDSQFLKDTGIAAMHELVETRGTARLPFDKCVFEFDPYIILAEEVGVSDLAGNAAGTEVCFYCKGLWDNGDDEEPPLPRADFLDDFADGFHGGSLIAHNWHDTFADDDDSPDADEGGTSDVSDEVIEQEKVANALLAYAENDTGGPPMGAPLDALMIAPLLFGILALMGDRLVATEVVPDQCRKLNEKRAKKGRLPLSADRRVLTINTAAVRRATQRTKLLSHESPRLHWRRGHWRVLHRYSEFESRTWVRRCLVGDPERGCIHKDYRVVWQPPMMLPNADATQQSEVVQRA